MTHNSGHSIRTHCFLIKLLWTSTVRWKPLRGLINGQTLTSTDSLQRRWLKRHLEWFT